MITIFLCCFGMHLAWGNCRVHAVHSKVPTTCFHPAVPFAVLVQVPGGCGWFKLKTMRSEKVGCFDLTSLLWSCSSTAPKRAVHVLIIYMREQVAKNEGEACKTSLVPLQLTSCLKKRRPWKSVLSWGVCFRMCHQLYSQLSKVKKHPKLQGPSCVYSWLHALVVVSMGSVRDVRQLVEASEGTALPDSHPSPDSKAGKWEAWEQSPCSDHYSRGEEEMQLKKIKMNSPWGCQILSMQILLI